MNYCNLQPEGDRIIQSAHRERIHSSIPPTGLELKRWINHILARPDTVNPKPFIPISQDQYKFINKKWERVAKIFPDSWNDYLKTRLKKIIREEIGDYYVQSNAKTAELTGLDLQAYGYRLP